MFFGFINGLFVAKVGIPSFLITLGMSSIILGIARWVSGLQSIPIINDRFTFLLVQATSVLCPSFCCGWPR